MEHQAERHILQNEYLSAEIKSRGAEWCSLKDKLSGREYIWQADPAIWPRHAPLLFPFVGTLNGHQYQWKGQHFPMTHHGFARDSEFRKVEGDHHFITLELIHSDKTLAHYPFPFRLLVTYRLEGRMIIQSFVVQNNGQEPMPYSLGGHPAFQADPIEDHTIEFDREEHIDTRIISSGLIGPETMPAINGNYMHLHRTIFNKDAFIFTKLKSNRFTLKNRYKGAILTLDKGNFPHLGIWSKPTAPFVCIEPWHGTADFEGESKDVFEKFGIIRLNPSESRRHYFSVTFH